MLTIGSLIKRLLPPGWPFLAVVLAGCLLPSPVRAEGYRWQVPTEFPLPPEPPPSLERPQEQPLTRGWMRRLKALGARAERTHDRMEASILQQAIKFDNFFGKLNNKKEMHTAYLLRWRNDLRIEDNGHIKLGSTLHVNLQLTRLDERLRLTFSGESEPDPFAPRLPEDPGNPGLDRTFPTARIVNTELRYQPIRSMATDFFVGTGVDLTWPLQVFVRTRYHHDFRLSDITLFRFTETLFAKSSDGPGETTELALERSLTPKTLLRFANSVTVSEEIGGLEWGSELSLLHALSSKDAITLTGGIYGNNHVQDGIDNYRLLLRYRRNFLRSWLFYELEPEVSWPRRDGNSFPTTYAFTFRLEVVFQGKENSNPK